MEKNRHDISRVLGCVSEKQFDNDDDLAASYSYDYERYQEDNCNDEETTNIDFFDSISKGLDLLNKGTQVANNVVDLSENWNNGQANTQNQNQNQFNRTQNNLQNRQNNRTQNNTMLYVGIGVGVLALGGLAIWAFSSE